jgi:hypothetical protein
LRSFRGETIVTLGRSTALGLAAVISLTNFAQAEPPQLPVLAAIAGAPENGKPIGTADSFEQVKTAEKAPSGLGLGFLHPLIVPNTNLRAEAEALATDQRDHVYVYFINGVDPLCSGNLNGLCDYVRSLGFSHATFGQMTAARHFLHKIRDVKAADPDAKIVLVGFSLGASCICNLAHWLGNEGIQVDSLIYLAGDLINNNDKSRPTNACRIVNITARGCVYVGFDMIWDAEKVDGAENTHVDVRHMALPSQPQTIAIVVRELVIAAQMPTKPAATHPVVHTTNKK